MADVVTTDRDRLFSHLSSLYRDPSKLPGGAYKGLTTFHKHIKNRQKLGIDPELQGHTLSRRLIEEWKHTDTAYTRYKPSRRKQFPRRPYKILNPDNIWEGDLLDMSRWSRKNNNIKFILVLVDQMTKKVYACPCKSKNADDVLIAFRNIFEKQTMSRPKIIYTDNGLEFTNSLVQNYLTNKVHVRHVTTKNPSIKCAIAERTNRTLKVTLVRIADHNNGRYIDDLDNVIRGYNETQHSATGFAPNNVTPINIDTVRQQLYRRAAKRRAQQFGKKTWDSGTDVKSAKLQIGEWVHLQDNRTDSDAFRRGYDPSFSKELYQIANVSVKDKQITYTLRDLGGNLLPSAYYYPELSKTIFPHKFTIDRSSPQRQFTDQLDPTVKKTKYRYIKINEYRQPIWIPDDVLQKGRSAEERRTHTISSAVFMHWLTN